VLAGVVFALLANLLTGGSPASVWGFIPANFVQSALLGWVFRRWRLDPSLPRRRELLLFIGMGVILSNLLGALLGMAALIGWGELDSLSNVWPFFFSWVVGNGLPCLVLGVPLLQAFSPLVVESPFFCKGWWGGSRPLHWSRLRWQNLPVAARLLLGFGVAGVLPILAVSAIQTLAFPQAASGPLGIVLPVMLNLSIFLSLIVSGRVARNIGRRVQVLAEGAQRLGSGDLTYRVAVEGADELGHLARTFNQMAENLVGYAKVLGRTTAEKERMERELEIAYEIQQSFLPQTFPDVPGVEIAATMRPAREVGGDFYDVIPLSGGRVGLLVADVSDKGMPAALYMALARTLLRTHSLSARPRYLSEALESAQVRRLMRTGSLGALAALGAVRQTNDYLTEHHSESCMFVTLFYAVYEPQSRLLTYVNAGHNPPLLYNALTGEQDWLQPTDMCIGVVPGRSFEAQECQLSPGDVLVLYTDGVTEAFNADKEMFGLERLIQVIRAHRTASAQELLEAIEAEVTAFTGEAPQSDDITLLIMRCGERVVPQGDKMAEQKVM